MLRRHSNTNLAEGTNFDASFPLKNLFFFTAKLGCPDRFHIQIYIYFHQNEVFLRICQIFCWYCCYLRYERILDVGINTKVVINKYHT